MPTIGRIIVRIQWTVIPWKVRYHWFYFKMRMERISIHIVDIFTRSLLRSNSLTAQDAILFENMKLLRRVSRLRHRALHPNIKFRNPS